MTPIDHDTALRAHWHGAADALTPDVQGRLRAARRTALSAPAARTQPWTRWAAAPAVALAAIAAVALLPRTPSLPAPGPAGTVASVAQPVQVHAETAAGDVVLLDIAALDDDPDFYLWLDGLAAAPRDEVRHDPS